MTSKKEREPKAGAGLNFDKIIGFFGLLSLNLLIGASAFASGKRPVSPSENNPGSVSVNRSLQRTLSLGFAQA